jgi:hypothetical protein
LDPAIETGRLPSRSGVVDAIDDIKGLTPDDIKGLTPHASRLNGTASVATTPVAFYVPLLEFPHQSEAVSVMRAIKMALDPDNIMNPGKILRL